MNLPQPEFLSNLHQTVWQLTGIILSVLFAIELVIAGIQRVIRQWRKP